MIKRYDKDGQFYLVAAIIVIAILIGLATVGNFAFTKGDRESIKVYELSKDLQLEGESVINYGIFNNEDLNMQLEQFTKDYGEYISRGDSDVYFVYGDKTKVQVRGYVNKVVGSIGLTIGASVPINIDIQGNVVTKNDVNIPSGEANVIVTVGGTNYPFELKKGQNFFFVIRQPIGSSNIEIGGSNVN